MQPAVSSGHIMVVMVVMWSYEYYEVIRCVAAHLGAESPVCGEHGEPDRHGHQHQEGRRGEGDQRQQELALGLW